MYNPTRLEWHPGDESRLRTPQFAVVGLDKHQARLLPTFNRLVAAHAKSQDPPERIEGFLLLDCPMRYVDGWAWDTRLHERAKAGSVGESLERGG